VEALAVVGQGILDVLFLPFIKQVLHGDAELFGWLLSLQAIGGLLGGMIAGHMSGKLSPTRLFGLSVGLVGATILIAANLPILPLIVPSRSWGFQWSGGWWARRPYCKTA
jgi:MFS family permease